MNAATGTLATRRKSAVETQVGAKILSGVLLLTSPSEQRTQVVAVSDTRKILAASVSLYQIERDTSSGLLFENSAGVVALSHLSYFGTDYLMTVSHYSSELESYALPSILYMVVYTPSGTRSWRAVQTYLTYGAADVVVFRIGAEVFSAIAHYYNGTSHNVSSEIVRISFTDEQQNPSLVPILTEKQLISTVGARAVVHFYGDGSSTDEMLVFASEMQDMIHLLVWNHHSEQFMTCHEVSLPRPSSLAVITTTKGELLIAVGSALQDLTVLTVTGRGLRRELVKSQRLPTGPLDYLNAMTITMHSGAAPTKPAQESSCLAGLRYGVQRID